MIALLLAAVALPAQGMDDAERARRIDLPALVVEDLPRWRELLRPAPEELAFEQIEWIPDFAAGIRRASQIGRPLLFWAMNGHPLACT